MTIHIRKPSEMTDAQKAQFITFVSQAGEVDMQTLPALVEQAHLLAELHDDGCLIGTAALKNPNSRYRNSVFEKAKALEKPSAYSLELGWIAVHADYRRQGHGSALVAASLKVAESKAVYATTKNGGMGSILVENGFAAIGKPYRSALDPNSLITLYCLN